MLADAIALAAHVHRCQYDKGGEPYILHPLYVMQTVKDRGFDEFTQCGAVLHDTIEDLTIDQCDMTPAQLIRQIEEVFGGIVLRMVQSLTKGPDEDYLGSYIPRLSVDTDSVRAIKIADLEHNLNPLRQPQLRDKDLLRLQKYHMALRMLRGEQ